MFEVLDRMKRRTNGTRPARTNVSGTPVGAKDGQEKGRIMSSDLDGEVPQTQVPVGEMDMKWAEDTERHIRRFNRQNISHEDLYVRARQAGDAANRAQEGSQTAQTKASQARAAYLTSQAEHPDRRAPLPRQIIITLATLGLDAVACYFAAEALGGGWYETILWTILFLAALGAAEVALDKYAERNPRAWRLVATGLCMFVVGLAILRFAFFYVVGNGDLIAAAVGAALFTAFTLGFVVAGYRSLRAAETVQTWKARVTAQKAANDVEKASELAERRTNDRDRLIDAYISRIRPGLLQDCAVGQLPLLEHAVRTHLLGRTS